MVGVVERQACRGCSRNLLGPILLNLGDQEIVDFLSNGEVGRGAAPLQLVQCEFCGLVQLRHTVDADTLFRKFWYRSSMNEQMRMALYDVVTCARNRITLAAGDAVLDIGSNDGELLLNYPAAVMKVGFEPAVELAAEAQKKFASRQDGNYEIWNSYFEGNAAMEMSHGFPYKIVTAIAMFYDLDNPLGFLRDVREVLPYDGDGIFVVQMNYLGLMVRNLAFDNISHEHLCYYSLTTLKNLFEQVGLRIFDAELNGVNGGSIRVYACRKEFVGHSQSEFIDSLLHSEQRELSVEVLDHFASRVEDVSSNLCWFLKGLKKAGKKVYAYGASTRGMTLLQTVFRNERASDYIIAAAERDEKKYGKRMAGLDIPIVSEELARADADYMLVLPYHFWQSIQEREKDWMLKGGKFILPLPYPKVIQLEDIGLVTHDIEADMGLLK